MGGGGIIIQNDAVKSAVTNPAIMAALPQACQSEVAAICAKGPANWTEADYAYMVGMLMVARHC